MKYLHIRIYGDVLAPAIPAYSAWLTEDENWSQFVAPNDLVVYNTINFEDFLKGVASTDLEIADSTLIVTSDGKFFFSDEQVQKIVVVCDGLNVDTSKHKVVDLLSLIPGF